MSDNCSGCNGAGSVRATTTGHGPDDYEYDSECSACNGTGSADLTDAINALPYSLHRVRAGVEVVSKAAVLAIIKARAALAAAQPPAAMPVPRNQGHGHVTQRPDGLKARCGGPVMCRVCQQEQANSMLAEAPTPQAQSVPATGAQPQEGGDA